MNTIYNKITPYLLFLWSAVVLSVSSPTAVYSWWEMGHLITAQIAYNNLRPDVKRLLIPLIQDLAEREKVPYTFITLANWADLLKKKNIDTFSPWHGIALPYDPDKSLSPDQYNLRKQYSEQFSTPWALNQCLKALKNPQAPLSHKSFMLGFLIHLMGDIHQPFHCITYYSKEFPEGDYYGYKLPLFTNNTHHEKIILHRLWDSALYLYQERYSIPLTSDQEKSITTHARLLEKQYPLPYFEEQLSISNPYIWAQESFSIAKEWGYEKRDLISNNLDEYITQAQPIAQKQITLSGYRLAQLLNSSLRPEEITKTDLSFDTSLVQ